MLLAEIPSSVMLLLDSTSEPEEQVTLQEIAWKILTLRSRYDICQEQTKLHLVSFSVLKCRAEGRLTENTFQEHL